MSDELDVFSLLSMQHLTHVIWVFHKIVSGYYYILPGGEYISEPVSQVTFQNVIKPLLFHIAATFVWESKFQGKGIRFYLPTKGLQKHAQSPLIFSRDREEFNNDNLV